MRQRYSAAVVALLVLVLHSACEQSAGDSSPPALDAVPQAVDCSPAARAAVRGRVISLRQADGRSQDSVYVSTSTQRVAFDRLTPRTACFVDLPMGAGWVPLASFSLTDWDVLADSAALNGGYAEFFFFAGAVDADASTPAVVIDYELAGRNAGPRHEEVDIRPLMGMRSQLVGANDSEEDVSAYAPSDAPPGARVRFTTAGFLSPSGMLVDPFRFHADGTGYGADRRGAQTGPGSLGSTRLARASTAGSSSFGYLTTLQWVPRLGGSNRDTVSVTRTVVTSNPLVLAPLAFNNTLHVNAWVYMPTAADIEANLRDRYRSDLVDGSVRVTMAGLIRTLEPGLYFARSL